MTRKRIAVISSLPFLIAILAALLCAAAVMHTAPEPAITLQTGSTAALQPKSGGMAGMKMDDMGRDVHEHPDVAKSATSAMSGHDMVMDGHMFMTDRRPENPADDVRAAEILAVLRPAIAKYRDYHVALAEGYRIFLPNVPQPLYHFTNSHYAVKAAFVFDPAHPTSLLYKKTNAGYELEGAMYTARRRASEEELNKRVPLSVARWHKHVNFCLPPRGMPLQDVDWKKFGAVSIVTNDACDAAGGRWLPQVFGWMVHVYPFEADPNNVWAH